VRGGEVVNMGGRGGGKKGLVVESRWKRGEGSERGGLWRGGGEKGGLRGEGREVGLGRRR
jgi:hypothetical protein